MIQLTDDGTLDTVLKCSECNEEFRFMFSEAGTDDLDPHNGDDTAEYDKFVDQCIEDTTEDHVCYEDEI